METILYCLRDVASCCQKSLIYSYPTFGIPVRDYPVHILPGLSEQKLEYLGYFAVLFAATLLQTRM